MTIQEARRVPIVEPRKMYGCITTGFFVFPPKSVDSKKRKEMQVNDGKNKWLHIRLSEAELKKVKDQFSNSTSRKLSDYARNKLLDKPIVLKYRNISFDDFVSEMVKLRNELNAIGNNFNQAVKNLHVLRTIPDLKHWSENNERDKKSFFDKIDEINNRIIKISEQWSQESIPVKASQKR